MTNPYPGLRPFLERDHDVFFGREQEIDDLVGRLAARRLIAVLGVSGCGKSSLVKAGLLPLLRSGLAEPLSGHWRIVTFCPGADPIAAMQRALDTPLERRSHALLGWARSRPLGEKVLIVVDQFEEIFAYRKDTLDIDGGNAAALFVDLLLTAVSDPAIPLYVVLTMRTDYLGECAVFRGLAELLNDGHYLVPRLTRIQQQDAIELPARACGVIPDPALVQRLLNDSEGDPDKLPVLQHLLKRLWECRNGGRFDLELYHTAGVGGWTHALERDAGEVLAKFPDEREGVARLFQWLADSGVGDRPVRRRRPSAELPDVTGLPEERVRRIVDAFMKRDILQIEDTAPEMVDLMHESVMWQWPELKSWIAKEAAEASRLRFFWEAASKRLPLSGATLEDAQALRSRLASTPNWAIRYLKTPAAVEETLSWIGESERLQQDEIAKLRRSKLFYKCALAAAIFIAGVIGWLAWRAYTSQQTAREQLARNYWEASRSTRDRGENAEALQLASEAIRLLPSFSGSLLSDVRAIWPELVISTQLLHQGPVFGAQFSRDESHILTWSADNTARLWDARTGQQLGPALQHQDSVSGAQFSRDGSRILTWSRDNTARLWDARTGQQLGPALQHQSFVYGAQFSRDDSRILTWSADHTARLWDARTGQQLGPALQHQDSVYGAQFSRDESRILTWSDDNTARLWDARTGQQLGPALQHQDFVYGAQFSRDESRILTWSRDNTARLWNARTGQQLGHALQHQGSVYGAQFSRDESRVLTWSADNTARLWDARTGQQLGPALQHQDPVHGAQFSRDESCILTWSADKTARLWDARTGQQLGPALQHQGPVSGAQFSRDGSRILTWSTDKTARLWNARTGQQLGPALQHQGFVYGAQFSRDESRILTWSADKTARLWDAHTGQQLGPTLQHQGPVSGAQFSRDESRILTWGYDKTVRLWPLNIDLDFPAEYVPEWLQAMTASQFDLVTRQLTVLSTESWRKVLAGYERIAAEHAKNCRYPEFNLWLRQHRSQN
jgi:WD40 repeat protein